MMRVPAAKFGIVCVLFFGFQSVISEAQYLGKFIGKLSELHHGVSGEVYAVDGRTLHIKDFTYDGQGPAAYFYAGNTRVAGTSGFRLRDENGNGDVIRKYRKEGVTLTLPEGKTLSNIKIFYVWCEEFAVNFGDVKIPKNFDYPRPQKIDGLSGVHNVQSDNIVLVDAQTLLIPNLSYDGEAPDAKFWVGRGSKPSPQGTRVPDENGKEVPLRRYDKKTVVLTLPGDLTVFDIGHFGIWCEAFTVDFGHVQLPQNLNVPPSLRMLGVSPQKRQQHNIDQGGVSTPHSKPSFTGGHLRPTTYRPPFAVSRRLDNFLPPQQHGLVHRAVNNNYVAQQHVVDPQQQKPQASQQQQYSQQQFLVPTGFVQQQQQIGQQQYVQQQHQQPQLLQHQQFVQYQPLQQFVQPQQLLQQNQQHLQPQQLLQPQQVLQPQQLLQPQLLQQPQQYVQPQRYLAQQPTFIQQHSPGTYLYSNNVAQQRQQSGEQVAYNNFLELKQFERQQLQQQFSNANFNRFNRQNFAPFG